MSEIVCECVNGRGLRRETETVAERTVNLRHSVCSHLHFPSTNLQPWPEPVQTQVQTQQSTLSTWPELLSSWARAPPRRRSAGSRGRPPPVGERRGGKDDVEVDGWMRLVSGADGGDVDDDER